MIWLGLDFRAGVLALVITSLVLYLLQPFAAKLNLLDHPQEQDHANPTPVTGGLAILIGCAIAFVFVKGAAHHAASVSCGGRIVGGDGGV